MDLFYGDVLQHLKAWAAAPPKMREVAALPGDKTPVLVSTALSSQDGAEKVEENKDRGEAETSLRDGPAA